MKLLKTEISEADLLSLVPDEIADAQLVALSFDYQTRALELVFARCEPVEKPDHD